MLTFQDEIDRLPQDQRSVQAQSLNVAGTFRLNDCYFGVPPNIRTYGLASLEKVPDSTTGFHFYLGAEQQPLLDAFVDSMFPKQTKTLHIGNSSFNLGKGRDYSGLTLSLARGHYPQLEVLELGVWQLFANEHCAYGHVGDITDLLLRTPLLQRLHIFGNFCLSKPVSLPHLKTLYVIVDDPFTGINGGPPDIATMSFLFRSAFPVLQEYYVDLEIECEHEPYRLPEEFLSGELLPNTAVFELVGTFQAGARKRLLDSELMRHGNMKKVHLDKMNDSSTSDSLN